MKVNILSITVITAALCGGFSVVNAYEIVCPERINVKYDYPEIENVPDGWDVSERMDRSLLLDGIDVYYDKPVKTGQLKPEPGIIDGKQYEFTWIVNYIRDTKGNYVSCSYNTNEVQLIKKIDPAMKSCWSVKSKDKYNGLEAKLKCSTSKRE